MEGMQHYGTFAHIAEICGACLRVMVLDDPESGIDTLKPYVRFRVQEAADLLDVCAKRLGGCTPQLDCVADRKSVASQRCRDTGGQPFDSAPTTLSDAEREAVSPAYRTFDDWYCEVEGYSSRFERLDGPASELRAAFAAGQSGMRLTGAEREAIMLAATCSEHGILPSTVAAGDRLAATLRALLERLK